MLDRTEAFAEVIGVPGIKWEQGGQFFGNTGQPMRLIDGAGVPDLDAPVVEKVAPAVAAGDFRRMTIEQLKMQMRVYGGEWTNRLDAIKFLEGEG